MGKMAPYSSMSRFVASKTLLPRHMPAFATTQVGSPMLLLAVSNDLIHIENSSC